MIDKKLSWSKCELEKGNVKILRSDQPSEPQLNLLNTTLPIITHLWVFLLRCQLSMELVPAWVSDCPLFVPSQSDLWPHFRKPTAAQTSPAPECVVWETRDSCELDEKLNSMLKYLMNLCHISVSASKLLPAT